MSLSMLNKVLLNRMSFGQSNLRTKCTGLLITQELSSVKQELLTNINKSSSIMV